MNTFGTVPRRLLLFGEGGGRSAGFHRKDVQEVRQECSAVGEGGQPSARGPGRQGSRVRGEAKGSSDIDIALRVDDKTFFELAEIALARAGPGSKLRKSMLARIRRNGQLGSFELGPEFIALRKEFCDSEAPFAVQFSVPRVGGRLDTPPFRPLA
ncbi:nucleotidyltransferase domain-containing protein [Allokutzneria albata]|uniref:hypothetical protein n=1 Tax=Allokutzneria albata TaxID=211114 RepID=UPI0012DEA5F3|nr:hypothetical protein [Allokutzneria albata]